MHARDVKFELKMTEQDVCDIYDAIFYRIDFAKDNEIKDEKEKERLRTILIKLKRGFNFFDSLVEVRAAEERLEYLIKIAKSKQNHVDSTFMQSQLESISSGIYDENQKN